MYVLYAYPVIKLIMMTMMEIHLRVSSQRIMSPAPSQVNITVVCVMLEEPLIHSKGSSTIISRCTDCGN